MYREAGLMKARVVSLLHLAILCMRVCVYINIQKGLDHVCCLSPFSPMPLLAAASAR